MRITICGDVCPKGTNELWMAGERQELFHDVPTAFENSDRVIVNLECALTDEDRPIEKIGPNLKASPSCTRLLKDIGVTDCMLANNHIFDYGISGVQDTINALAEAGLSYSGFGNDYNAARENLIIGQDGKRIAVIAVCEHEYSYALPDRMGCRVFESYDTMEDIHNAKKENDYVIVLFHGGKEQSIYPSPRLRKQSQVMIRSGADVVLCQHSHCIGCYEEYMGGHILYGQGNFHFTEMNKEHPHWQSGLIVHLDIDEQLNIEFVPVHVVGKGIQLAKGEHADDIMDAFRKQSEHLQTNEWKQGWVDFCISMKEVYLRMIRNAYTEEATQRQNEFFAHYLYCESHRDVWEELCKLSWETRREP